MPLVHFLVDGALLDPPGGQAAQSAQTRGEALRRVRLRVHEALAALDRDPHEHLLWS